MRTALVVDDSAVGRLIIGRLVRRAGWDVVEAENGRSALAILERDPPDVVFLDLLMPGMTGLDVLEDIQRRGIVTPVVVVTAEIQEHNRVACERLGVYAYLNKPVRQESISDILARIHGVFS